MKPAKQEFFPLDDRLALQKRSVFSPELARDMVWLASLMPYEQAKRVLERVGGHTIASASIWHQVQAHGKRMKTYLKKQEDLVGVERVVLPAHKADHNQRKGVSIDGGMMHIRGEGWKEFKTGVVFDIEMRLERDKQTHELAKMPHAKDMDRAKHVCKCGYLAKNSSPKGCQQSTHSTLRGSELTLTVDSLDSCDATTDRLRISPHPSARGASTQTSAKHSGPVHGYEIDSSFILSLLYAVYCSLCTSRRLKKKKKK